MARNVSLTVVYEEAVSRYFETSDPYRFQVHLTRKLKERVKLRAPKRSGTMAKSIRGRTPRSGRLINQSVVSVNTSYAIWVIKGTADKGRGFIYRNPRAKRAYDQGRQPHLQTSRRELQVVTLPDGTRAVRAVADKRELQNQRRRMKGLYMGPVPPGAKGSKRFHLRVKGQEPNNFMQDALTATLRAEKRIYRIPSGVPISSKATLTRDLKFI